MSGKILQARDARQSMWEAQRDGVRAGAAGESSDVPQAHWTNTVLNDLRLMIFLLRPNPTKGTSI